MGCRTMFLGHCIIAITSIINIHAVEIVNSTNSPKFVEIFEQRPIVEQATFPFIIFKAEIQPGETRLITPSSPELLIDVRWGKKSEQQEEKYVLREADASRITQWRRVGQEFLYQLIPTILPIVVPPHTPISKTKTGIMFQLESGNYIELRPENSPAILQILAKEVPYRLMHNNIIEKVMRPVISYSNKRIQNISLAGKPCVSYQQAEIPMGKIIISSVDNDHINISLQ